MLMTRNRNHVPSLTGLRAIAAYMVFFHHFTPSTHILGNRLFHILWQGHVGVSIFFVLSGFLIAFNYYDSVKLDSVWLRRYFRNRFARIYPMYAVCTVIALVYIEDFRPEAWFMNLTLLRGFFGDWYFYYIGQAWSLSAEAVFYLLSPILLITVGRYPIGLHCLFFYLIAIIGVSISGYFGDLRFFDPLRMVAINTFFGRSFEFLFGMWVFIRFRHVDYYTFRPWLTYFGVASFIGMMWYFSECPGIAVYCMPCAPVHHFVFPLIVGVVIFALWKEDSGIKDFLGSPLLVLLGKSSYVFYLIHASPFADKIFGLENSSVMFHFLVVNLVSIAAFYVLERPLHRFFRAY